MRPPLRPGCSHSARQWQFPGVLWDPGGQWAPGSTWTLFCNPGLQVVELALQGGWGQVLAS